MTIEPESVICKQPGRYIGWPTIGRMPEGELLVVFSGDRDAHVDPFGKTFLIRSSDNGRTWTSPELVNDTPLDDRDAGICITADQTVVVSWFTSHYEEAAYMRRAPTGEQDRWLACIRSVTRADIRQWAGEKVVGGRYATGRWIRRSTDRGRTWEEPVRVPLSAPHGPISLADGRLLYVGIDDNTRHSKAGHFLIAESKDQGRSWSVIARVPRFPAYGGSHPDGRAWLTEPHVVERSPDSLLAMARYEEIPRQQDGRPSRSVLYQFTSDDGGFTWTTPEPTGIVGKPPHLTRLAGGRIVVTYGYRSKPYGQRACLSADGGRTWDYEHEIVLHDRAPSNDLGYPASVELGDGEILTVYYQQEHAGEKPVLMATRWRLDGA